jgi:predicted transcriptional regulator
MTPALHQNYRFVSIAARHQAGVTQEKLARITQTRKSAISRLENHAEDVRLSTISRVAPALGKTVRIELVEPA